VNEADILLHVVDITDSNLLQKVEAVEDVLREIEATDKPTIIALNKVDLVDPETDLARPEGPFAMRHSALDELEERYPHVVMVSAQQGVGMDELLGSVEQTLVEQMVDMDVVIPYQSGDLLSMWHKQGVIEEQKYVQAGVRVRGKLPKWMVGIVTGES
jgi:GTP-binding protein HflX